MLDPALVIDAYERIKPYINKTPILQSSFLNEWFGHNIYFKVETFQKTGAFKARGALNTILALKETKQINKKNIVAFSSGNHAQGVAWACKQNNIQSTIYLPKFTSKLKIQATKSYGANVIITNSRQEAEKLTKRDVELGSVFIHPFDNDFVIAGQGTACLEALNDGITPDSVFVPIGGGGLFSGTKLALQSFGSNARIYAAEPKQANDAARSVRLQKIYKFSDSPNTIADGARTMSVSERTFEYVKQADGVFEIEEREICFWTQVINNFLKITCEPTSALAMAGAYQWMKKQKESKNILIIISGGNLDNEAYKQVYKENLIEELQNI